MKEAIEKAYYELFHLQEPGIGASQVLTTLAQSIRDETIEECAKILELDVMGGRMAAALRSRKGKT